MIVKLLEIYNNNKHSNYYKRLIFSWIHPVLNSPMDN